MTEHQRLNLGSLADAGAHGKGSVLPKFEQRPVMVRTFRPSNQHQGAVAAAIGSDVRYAFAYSFSREVIQIEDVGGADEVKPADET